MVDQSLAYYYEKDVSSAAASFGNSGDQILLLAEPNKRDFLNPLKLQLPAGVCGPGWGIQLDVIRYAEGTFTIPQKIPRQQTLLSNAGVLVKAMHVEAPACPPPAPEQCVVTFGTWSTEPDDTAPTLVEDGLRFVGGVNDAMGVGIGVGGNLQGLPEISYVAQGDAYSLARFYPRIVIDSSADGGPGYNSITVTSEGPVNGSSVASGRVKTAEGTARVSKTIAEWIAHYPNNKLLAFFFNTDSSSNAEVSVLLKSVTAGVCFANAWGYGPNPGPLVAFGKTTLGEYDCLDREVAEIREVFTTTFALVNGEWIPTTVTSTQTTVRAMTELELAENCEPPTLPVINVTASSVPFFCETVGGSFTFGVSESREGDDRYGTAVSLDDILVWTTSMNPQPTLPGTVPVSEAGVITVTVDVRDEFAATYGLNDESRLGEQDPQTGAITYVFRFTEGGPCLTTGPSTVADATFVMPDCLGNPGRVVLTNEGGVIWTLNGRTVLGNSSYDASPGTLVALSAALEGPTEGSLGYTWNDPDQQTQWTQAFPAPANCELQTLAFTGAGAVTNWLGVAAALLMVAGMGFVVRRSRVEV